MRVSAGPAAAALVRLDEVASANMGQSPSSTHVEDGLGAGLPFLQGNAEFGTRHPAPTLSCSQPRKTCSIGDVLISVRAPVGALNIADRVYCIGRGLAAISFGRADPVFGAHALRFYSAALRRVSQGTTFEAIGSKELLALKLWLPPLAEQRRIGEILDTLDEAIQKTEQLIAKLKLMKQGLLHDLLTRGIDENGELRDPERPPELFKESELGLLPGSWRTMPLGAAAELVDPNPSHRYPVEVEEGIPIASTENFLGDDDFDLGRSKKVPEYVFAAQTTRCRFAEDDVVFARKGRIGFARPYGRDRKVFSHTVVVVKALKGAMTPRFLLWTMRSGPFFRGIRDRMNSNLGVPTLGVGFLSAVVVAVPSLDEQRRAADALDAADGRVSREEAYLAKLRRLQRGLAEDLLSGRVRVNALLDEVAA